ncbi:hypothetical protein LIER_00401 [Lithospermum erythrorhizon]|uniref:Uncharacterized protein n=1 Tax=Lithospermum erythrorhizon TaxID=34254 RepID=A0AAV3NLQ6_LITER
MSVADYFGKLQPLWDELATYNPPPACNCEPIIQCWKRSACGFKLKIQLIVMGLCLMLFKPRIEGERPKRESRQAGRGFSSGRGGQGPRMFWQQQQSSGNVGTFDSSSGFGRGKNGIVVNVVSSQEGAKIDFSGADSGQQGNGNAAGLTSSQ